MRHTPPKIGDSHATYEGLTVGDGIVRDLAAGRFKAHAAHLAGISYPTLKRWMQRGEAHADRLDAVSGEYPDMVGCGHEWDDGTCAHCSISKDLWRDLAHQDRLEAQYLVFFLAAARAQAGFVADCIDSICNAAEAPAEIRGDWRARAWLLERLDPSSFALERVVKVSGDPDGAPIVVSKYDELESELAKLHDQLTAPTDA